MFITAEGVTCHDKMDVLVIRTDSEIKSIFQMELWEYHHHSTVDVKWFWLLDCKVGPKWPMLIWSVSFTTDDGIKDAVFLSLEQFTLY